MWEDSVLMNVFRVLVGFDSVLMNVFRFLVWKKGGRCGVRGVV